jgi:hypothetical protein
MRQFMARQASGVDWASSNFHRKGLTPLPLPVLQGFVFKKD